jgi:hypothetical protein
VRGYKRYCGPSGVRFPLAPSDQPPDISFRQCIRAGEFIPLTFGSYVQPPTHNLRFVRKGGAGSGSSRSVSSFGHEPLPVLPVVGSAARRRGSSPAS